MSQATYLADIAHGLLDTSIDALSMDRTGHAAPGRSHLSWGNPAADTFDPAGQLTVCIDPVGQGGSVTHVQPNPRMDALIVPRATFMITLLRAVPTLDEEGQPHRAKAYDSSAADLMTDLWSVMTALYEGLRTYKLFEGQCVGCDDVKIGRTDLIQPSGGSAGFNIRLDVMLNDRGPILGS